MKITAIKPFPVWIGHRNQLVIKIETDEGIFGWGESGLSGRELAVVGAIQHYAEFLKGRDPFQTGALWQEMYRSQYFEGGRVLQAAISAIDIALHDIKGKALGVPVYELLGGKQRDHIPTFASTNAPDAAGMIEQAQALRAAGWTAIRFFPDFRDTNGFFEPREHIAKTARACVLAREALGDEVVLGIDWHHRLSVAEAASFCQKMPSGTLDFLEEPIRDETPEAYEALRKLTDVPFAIGCAMHMVDPGAALTQMVTDAEPQLRARALRAVGELGRRDLLAACVNALQDEDPACRFWAAWSVALLGDRGNSVRVLESFVLLPNAFRGRALRLLLKVLDLPGVQQLLKAVAHDPANKRLLIQGAGIAGDALYLPWLLGQMAEDKFTCLAGESFSMITGLDLAYLDLERKPPENIEAGPTENPEDENVEMDPDDSLPWPDTAKIQAWWQANQAHYPQGVRYFMGEPVSVLHCQKMLREGYQRQRIAAAEYLCLLNPGTLLFNTRAPAWRQQRWLAKMG